MYGWRRAILKCINSIIITRIHTFFHVQVPAGSSAQEPGCFFHPRSIRMICVHGLSTEAKIGKILMLTGLVLGLAALLYLLLAGTLPFSTRFFPEHILRAGVMLIAVIKTVGLVCGVLALVMAGRGRFQLAGILAVIGSLLPPVDLILLLGGLFCLASREGRMETVPDASRKNT